mgnify:CR=1 FL=1
MKEEHIDYINYNDKYTRSVTSDSEYSPYLVWCFISVCVSVTDFPSVVLTRDTGLPGITHLRVNYLNTVKVFSKELISV